MIPAGQRARLEQVCRYLLRPPVASERVRVTGDGQVCLSLRHPWRDGTTAFVFDPVAFLSRLAVLVPRPRVNLVLYYGVIGARSAWRGAVVPGARGKPRGDGAGAASPGRGIQWATLMARTFGLDVLACPRCGGRLRFVALIEQAAVAGRILRHLGLPLEIPRPRPARAPPCVVADASQEDLTFDLAVFAPGSISWCAITSRRFERRPRAYATGRDCRALLKTSFARSSRAGVWRPASPGSGARRAA